jgi:soluble lytic murein transglycosylase-like protein
MISALLWLSLALDHEPCGRRDDVVAVRHELVADGARLEARETAARALPAGRAQGCAAAVLAHAFLRRGDSERALTWLETTLQAFPELVDDLRPMRIGLLVRVGRRDDARRAWEGLAPDSEWSARLAWEVADDDAQDALLRRRASKDPHALAALCERKDRAACATLLVRHPGHPVARAREDALLTSLSDAERVARVKSLVSAARPLRAILEGLPLAQRVDDDVANRAHREALIEPLTNALWRADRTAEALALTDVVTDNRGRPVAAFVKARARTLSRLNRAAEAAATWAILRDSDDVDGTIRAEAAFFAGFVLVEGALDPADVTAAEAAFDAGASLMQGTSWHEQALWYRALLRLMVGNDAASAEPLLTTLSSMPSSEPLKYRYWRAHALERLGRREAAHHMLKTLATEAPLDWYGLLARRALSLAPIAGAVVPAAALTAKAPHDDDARVIRWLYALGFDDEARARCRRRVRGAPSLADVGLCQLVEEPSLGWRHGGRFLPRRAVTGDHLVNTDAWRASYPRPWAAVVDNAASAAEVPSSFVMGIMRTESGFDRDAVSVAGAVGLLQLLPSVARSTAKATSLPPRLAEHLREPDAVIAVGAHLLGLLRREHGSLLLAAAAYNAGPAPVTTWATRFGHLPVDRFVERIPFRETRAYVKKVLAAEALYRALDGGPLSLELPTTITPASTFTPLPYDE